MSHGNTLITSLQHTGHSAYDEVVAHRGVAQRCCDTGRPVASDPVTGRTICSCQLQTGAQTYLSRVPTLPEHIYGPFHSQLPQSHSTGMGQPAFYSMDNVTTDRRTDSYAVPQAGHVPYYYDQLISAHPYAAIPQGFDFNAARRKNATRETTGPLKAWLNAHRKNPYPTKGEKVMLAIITRMTLTQVSTWFANARRRLKKDNVFGEDDFDQDDKLSKDDSVSSQNSLTEEEKRPLSDTSGISDISDADIDVDDVTSRRKPVRKCVQRLFSPDIRNDIVLERIASPEQQINIPDRSEESADIHMLNGSSLVDAKPRTEPFLSLERLAGQMASGNITQKIDNDLSETYKHKGSVKRKFEESDSEAVNVNAAKKPKIWSISQIIG